MKKVLSFAVVTALFSVAVSCSHNDYQTPSVILPAQQADTINQFIAANGYNMIELTDSARLGTYNSSTGTISFQNILTQGIMYEVLDQGATTQDTVSVAKSAVGSSASGTVATYNLITDSTQILAATYTVTLLNGTVIGQSSTPALFFLPQTLPCWSAVLPKIGKGGHIRFVTPSYYAYGNGTSNNIPANSPLYFDVYLVAAINNNMLSGL